MPSLKSNTQKNAGQVKEKGIDKEDSPLIELDQVELKRVSGGTHPREIDWPDTLCTAESIRKFSVN